MTINLRDLFPAIQPIIESVASTPIVHQVNEIVWIFALVETAHLLFIAILGGAVLGLNLRLLDRVLPGVSVQDVERAIRPWYYIGVIGAVVTGVAMGITTARTLLPNGAFFVKMIALLAAILYSHIVVQQVRNGKTTVSENGLLAFASLLWGAALFLFVTTEGLKSGALLIGLGGAGLLAAVSQRRHRPVVVGLSAAGLCLWFFALDGGLGRGEAVAWFGHGIVAATVIPALGMGVRDIRAESVGQEVSIKLAAFASTLAWVTVTAAGRWIGFS